MKVVNYEFIQTYLQLSEMEARHMVEILKISGSDYDIKIAESHLDSTIKRNNMIKDLSFDPQDLYFPKHVEIA